MAHFFKKYEQFSHAPKYCIRINYMQHKYILPIYSYNIWTQNNNSSTLKVFTLLYYYWIQLVT